MIEVTFYDAAGKLVRKSVYGSYRTAWQMACLFHRILKGGAVSVRNLVKVRGAR